jgi:hypothetical protein
VKRRGAVISLAGGTEIWHRVEIVFETWMPDFLAERFLQY